jgi:type I restriction enzyme, R subunit
MEREAFRVKLFMGMINQAEKTLVFCATQEHALAVRDLINQMKTSSDPHYCERVTANDGELGNQHLREFQDNGKTIPTVLTSSQKLSTGVDARNIRNIVLMRPINSMIEFKQIIGRGTRLYEGKEYFTIYDFVQAHHHFSDPEWDGEPIAPEPAEPRAERGHMMREPSPEPLETPEPRPKVKVKLADGKARSIQNMVVTTFWHPDGTPMTAQQFMELLFGKLPDFFKSEEELRQLWCTPKTRADLLHRLEEKGFGSEQLSEMQRIIDADNSDLFDVLAFVAYALPTITRTARAATAQTSIKSRFNPKQQSFIDFVLTQYVHVGVDELALDKLAPLLRLKYQNALADAIADLGQPEEISKVFAGFQQYLYPPPIAG